ncbi:MAG: dihydrofolate reductase family protein [Hyphomicrobiaceae bacterium]
MSSENGLDRLLAVRSAATVNQPQGIRREGPLGDIIRRNASWVSTMTTGHVFMAMSLDGFVARSDGSVDWLMKQKVEGENHGFDAFMASVDGMVMGRASYQNVLTFGDWPYKKTVVVMSRTLTDVDIPDELKGRVRLSNLTPRELMEQLDNEGWKRAYVDGGKIVQSFLSAGLIKDIELTHIPILIGDGIQLFGRLKEDIDLEHIETRSFPSGLVTSKYKIC